MEFCPVKFVIFDMDGLLLDTEPLYSIANDTVLKRYGKEFTWELKQKQMGRRREDAIRVLLDAMQLSLTVEEYAEQYETLLRELMPNAPLMPGAERLVRHLQQKKIPIAVCTSSVREFFELKTRKHRDLFGLFHHIVCGDDPEVKAGKPAPDCFLVCASRFEPQPNSMQEVLVFEDAANGVEAALSAGAQVVMVPDGRTEKHVRDQATLSMDSLKEFAPQRFSLPSY